VNEVTIVCVCVLGRLHTDSVVLSVFAFPTGDITVQGFEKKKHKLLAPYLSGDNSVVNVFATLTLFDVAIWHVLVSTQLLAVHHLFRVAVGLCVLCVNL